MSVRLWVWACDYHFIIKTTAGNIFVPQTFISLSVCHSHMLLKLLEQIGIIVHGFVGLCRTSEIFGVSEFVVRKLSYIDDKMFQSLSVTAHKWISITEVW